MNLVDKLKKLIASIGHTSLGHSAEQFFISESAKAVAVLKTTHIGQTVAQLIQDAEDKNVPKADRLMHVVEDVAPLIVTYLLNKGQAKVDVSEVRSTAIELSQAIFNDLKSTSAGQVATAILKGL